MAIQRRLSRELVLDESRWLYRESQRWATPEIIIIVAIVKATICYVRILSNCFIHAYWLLCWLYRIMCPVNDDGMVAIILQPTLLTEVDTFEYALPKEQQRLLVCQISKYHILICLQQQFWGKRHVAVIRDGVNDSLNLVRTISRVIFICQNN